MQFSVGDKVVHPHHGAGNITGLENRELLDGKKCYYVIVIPAKELTVRVPKGRMEQVGVRRAMSHARLGRVLETLRSEPHDLPADYKTRQEQVSEKLRTGRVGQVTEVIRDLTWHKRQRHLTRKDSDLLAQGTKRLAAEMALVSDSDASDMERRIADTLALSVPLPG